MGARIKRGYDGTIESFKARHVVCGNKQRTGDYNEIYATVVDFTTIRVALALGQYEKAHIQHMDVSNAFLYGNLEQTVYIEQPPRFKTRNKDQVFLVKKSLYGLKQAPRVWHMHLESTLSKLNFKKYNDDERQFVRTDGISYVGLFIYVDDTPLISNNLEMLNKVKRELAKQYKVTYFGEAELFSVRENNPK